MRLTQRKREIIVPRIRLTILDSADIPDVKHNRMRGYSAFHWLVCKIILSGQKFLITHWLKSKTLLSSLNFIGL